MKKQLIYFLLFLFPCAYSCLDTPDMTVGPVNMREKPSVVSEASISPPSDGVLSFSGKVLSVGKADKIFEKGFYWGFDPKNLTDSVMVESADFQPGPFSGTLYNVLGDTTIYWRAFARNDFGIDTGAIRSNLTPRIFEARDNFRALIRLNFAAFALGNNLYVTCGYNTALFSDIKRYDTNQWWYDLPDFPGAARRYPVAFTINDSLAYVGTGQGYGLQITFGDFYVFNGHTQKWNTEAIQTPAEMPRYGAVAFSLNNKGYIVGGYDGSVLLNDVWEYSITNNIGSWKKKNNFPEPFSGSISLYNNGRAFVGFGDNLKTDSALWEYNSINDSWNKIKFANSPTYSQGEQAKFISGVMLGGKIYLLDETKIIWELDLTTKAFKQKSALPPEFLPLNEQYMFSLGNVIYIGLGGTDLFYRYNPLWDN